MPETTPFTIGAQASCTDGVCGGLARVVVDPVARTLTHLVIQPEDRLELARLVPLDLVDDATAGEIRLRCSLEEFERLDPAEETRFLPGGTAEGYGVGEALSWPYYSLGPGLTAVGADLGPMSVTYDTIPLGEVEVRRSEHVHATDGSIGRVQGLVIERAVARVDPDDGIQLSITKQQVQELPPVDIDHPSP